MRHKFTLAICSVLVLWLLTGCTLAQDAPEPGGERLVGVLVTTEYLDLFDIEAYLNDNMRSLSGGEISVDGRAQQYQERLYASPVTKTLTSDETGEKTEVTDYVFDSVEGFAYLAPRVPATDTRDSYVSSFSDDAISDGHMALSYGDEESSLLMEGTIYCSSSGFERTYYFNPVYQSADGSVYALSGSGFSVSGDTEPSEGSLYSQTLTDSSTFTENGESQTETAMVKISLSVLFPPEKLVLLQMDSESNVIERTEYAAVALPETIAPLSDCAYLILESHKLDDTGAPLVTREIYSKDAEGLESFFSRDNGIYVKKWTALEWE